MVIVSQSGIRKYFEEMQANTKKKKKASTGNDTNTNELNKPKRLIKSVASK